MCLYTIGSINQQKKAKTNELNIVEKQINEIVNKIKIEENYRDGKRVRYALYNDDGSLRVEMFYKDNKEHGDYKSFQSNGNFR